MNPSAARIVLIDDDPDMHHAVRLMLEPAGHRVDCYLTGSAGLAAIREAPPDLILLDIMLASPTEGIELAVTLRQDPRLASIPIVMISSVDPDVARDLARQAGVDDLPADRFLEKPLTPTGLIEAVRETLQPQGEPG